MAPPNETVLFLRAHRHTPALAAAFARYADLPGHDVFVVYDNDRGDYASFGLPALCQRAEDFPRAGLPYVKGNTHFGIWKNGDYALYLAAAALPRRYRYYWLIEYDVYVNFDPLADFFALFAGSDADCLAPYCGPKPPEWLWANNLDWIAPEVYGCFFPVLRLSAPALAHCRLARQYYGYKLRELGLRGPSWPHCEAFVPTVLAQAGFRLRDLNDFGLPLCDTAWFHARTADARDLTDPLFRQPDRKLYHPVYPEPTAG